MKLYHNSRLIIITLPLCLQQNVLMITKLCVDMQIPTMVEMNAKTISWAFLVEGYNGLRVYHDFIIHMGKTCL